MIHSSQRKAARMSAECAGTSGLGRLRAATAAKRVVMCGCAEVGANLIASLIDAGVRFSHFVALTPEQGRKYEISGYADLRPLAEQHGIPIYVPKSYALTDAADVAFFREGKFDLLIQGGWQRLFPPAVLETLSIGAVGAHGSSDFLPKGRGRSPLNWSLIEGRRRFLLHLFLIKAGVDDGDVFAVEDFDITPFDDIETLYLKVSLCTRRMLIQCLPDLLADKIEAWPQVGEPSYYPKRTPGDGLIDWEKMNVDQIYDFIRAQTRPYPGAFGPLDGRTLRIWKARPFDTRIRYPGAAYGEIVERFGERLLVNCRGGLLLVEDYETVA
jgi:methionyl-tRNA formyltransferase